MGKIREISLKNLSEAEFMKLKNSAVAVHSLGELSLQQLAEGLDLCLFKGGYCMLPDPFSYPLENYDLKISSCIVRDGCVDGMMLFELKNEEGLKLLAVFSAGEDPEDDIEAMASFSVDKALDKCSLRTKVIYEEGNKNTDFLWG